MQVKFVRKVSNLKVQYCESGCCFATKGLTVLRTSNDGETWRPYPPIQIPGSCSKLPRSQLFERLTRGGVQLLRRLYTLPKPCWLIVAQRKLMIAEEGEGSKILYNIERGSHVLRHSLSLHNETLYLGEYWRNTHREAVRILAISLEDGSVNTLYSFPAGTVRHIHTVQRDPFDGGLWISTGDLDHECITGILDPVTGQFDVIGSKEQKWRAVSFAFRENAVYWGTDNHLGENQIWRLDRSSGCVEEIGSVKGPVYYNASLSNYIVFGTTMEKGEGQQDGYGRLYLLDLRSGTLDEVWKEKKDRWSARFFGYGMFEFAQGEVTGDEFWVTMKGFEGGLRSVLFRVTGSER